MENVTGDELGIKDSEFDDVFEEAVSTPDTGRRLRRQQLHTFGLGVGGVERDGRLVETPRGEENGIYERFEEALDHPDEDRSSEKLKTDAGADGREGGAEGLAAFDIESRRLDVRGDGNGAGVGERDEIIGVRGHPENGDSGGLLADKAGFERGMVVDDDDKCAAHVELVTELNVSESNGTAGAQERDGNPILGELLDHKEEEDGSCDGIIPPEQSGKMDADPVALEKGDGEDYDGVGTKKLPAVFLEKSQNGKFGNACVAEEVSVALKKSDYGKSDGGHGEEITNDKPNQDGSLKTEDASVDTSAKEKKILHQDDSQGTADASAALGSSVGEEKMSFGLETQKPVVSDLFSEGKIPREDENEQMIDTLSVGDSFNLEKSTYNDKRLQMQDALSVDDSSTGEEKTSCQDESQGRETLDDKRLQVPDTSSVAGISTSEEKMPTHHKSQCREVDVANVANSVNDATLKTEDPLPEVCLEIGDGLEAQTCNSEVLLSSNVPEIVSDSTEAVSGNHELQRKEETLPVDTREPVMVELLDRESVSAEKCGESSDVPEIISDSSEVASGNNELQSAERPLQEDARERVILLDRVSISVEEYVKSNNVSEILSDSSEVVSGNNEPQRVEQPLQEGPSERVILLDRESVSVEEYGESSSAEEEDESDLIVQPSQAVRSSAVNHMEAPPPRPAGLGSSVPLLDPAPRAMQQPRVNGNTPQRQSQIVEETANAEAEEYDETREKLQMIRVKFLRLAHRLGQTPHNVVVAQVLYRLGLAEQLRGSRNMSRAGAFSFDRASAMAEQLEAAGQEALDFSCTIMVLGKTGVGKSATINSIFDEVKFSTDAFKVGTTKVQDIVGMVQGIKVRVIDTPGLHSSCMDQRQNEKVLHSVKAFIKKTPPDIVLYLDRLDMQNRDFGDVPLLRTITDIFGPSIWFNAIVVLTHAASAPPDGPNGSPLSYEMFVTQRSHVVQQAIRQAAGDSRLMNPVSLVENHSACRTNRAGQRVLPNGQVWKPQLLLLSFASKILAEANTLLKLQDGPPGKPFTARTRSPPLPFLLSSLLQSRPQLKLPEEQFGDEDAMDEYLDDTSDSDDLSEYDELPPFRCLTKAQLSKLSKAEKKAYYDEIQYREKLFMKKQLKEEKMRRKLLKKMAAASKDLPSDYNENPEEEAGGTASVPVPMPDMPLPASFDSDNPTHRYRYLDNSNPWLIRPVLENHGWDHDVGYEGLNVERLFVIKDSIPVSFSGQVTKDKKDCNFQMELASALKHGERKATSVGFDAQTVGKDTAYTLRAETRFLNTISNIMAAGLSCTMLGDAITAGLKLEDKLVINKRLRLVLSGGAMTSRGDVAYGGSLEATLRDKDHPIGQSLSTLGVSVMDWHGDLAIGCNVRSQFPVGRTTNMIARANLNNRGSGQVSLRLNSSEQLQIALIAAIPVFRNIVKNRFFTSWQP